jgi:hypothetical protein
MKPIRYFTCTVVLASLVSAAGCTTPSADVPLSSRTTEGHFITRVLAVDPANYRVTIEGPDKRPMPIQLTDQAKALPNLRVGDRVDIRVMRSLAYVLNTGVDGEPGISDELMTTRATSDNPNPGGEAIHHVRVTSKITYIDLVNHHVTLLTPDGKSQVLKVEDPALQARMKNLQVGQTVNAVYTEVLNVQTSR